VLDNKMVGTCESTDEGIVDLGYEHKPSLLYGALTFPYKFQLPLIVDGDAAMIGHRGSFSRDGESWRTDYKIIKWGGSVGALAAIFHFRK
jgi:hypothetical protein